MRRLLDRFIAFYWGSGIADDAPALTYYLVLSLAPFALGLTAMAALLFGGEVTSDQVAAELSRLLPETLHDDIVRLVGETKDRSPGLLAVAIGSMLWTASGAIGVIERVLARLMGSPRYGMAVGKLRNLGLGLALALLLIASAGAATLTAGVRGHLPLEPSTFTRLVSVANFAGAAVACACIYRLAPRERIDWRAAMAGAAPAALMLQVSPLLVGLYLDTFVRVGPGSIFLGLAVVLAGCMLLAQGLLVGAGVAARLHLRRRERTGTSR